MSANTSYEVNKRYKDKTYDRPTISVRKDTGFKDKWEECAKKENLSLNKFIIKAINYYVDEVSKI